MECGSPTTFRLRTRNILRSLVFRAHFFVSRLAFNNILNNQTICGLGTKEQPFVRAVKMFLSWNLTHLNIHMSHFTTSIGQFYVHVKWSYEKYNSFISWVNWKQNIIIHSWSTNSQNKPINLFIFSPGKLRNYWNLAWFSFTFHWNKWFQT